MFGFASGADRIAKAIFVEPPEDSPEKIYLISAEKNSIEVALPSRNFSPDIVLPQGDLVLAILPRLLSEDEQIPKGAPMVRIPKEWSRTYLIFAFTKDNKVFPMEALPVNGSSSVFPLGHTRIVNLSSAMVQGLFGEKVITIKPRAVEAMAPPREDFGSYPVKIDYLMKGDEKPSSLARTKWLHNPQARQIMLITKPATMNRPRIRGIEDYVSVVQQ